MLSAALLASAPLAQGVSLEFVEDYALAPDRGQVVARLLPGSEEWYEYTCREKQAAGDLAAAEQLLSAWIKEHGRTQRAQEVENRQALLAFEESPRATFAFLRQRLGFSVDNQRAAPGAPSAFPTRLDPALIAREAWTRRVRQEFPLGLQGFADPALFWLAGTELDDGDLHQLLARLQRPDVPGLPALIVRDLQAKRGSTFGSLPIHGLLRVEHLEECARLYPALLQEPRFVAAWVERLQPDADSPWRHDRARERAYLERLGDLAGRLPPVHNSFKAHVLYHTLALDLAEGGPDKQRFLAYLRLPRPSGMVLPAYRERFQRAELVDMSASFATGLAPIHDDEPLVRACLEHFFTTEDRIEPYAEFLDSAWLRGVLAATRLQAGDPDAMRWYALLGDPARVEALAQKVELSFPPSVRAHYAALDPVALEVDVKNVSALLVKVFAVDAYRYMVETGREVDESLELDGLVASFEQTLRFDEPPVRRVRRRLELPILSSAGTFVVELIGNGLASRAVIQKGFLRHVEVPGAAGHVFRIFDEAGARVPDATLWFGGREYLPDEQGEIVVPFSSDPGQHTLVLRHGERASLARFHHVEERYQLRSACHVDREALIAGARARLVLRPELLLAGRPVTLALLAEPVLTLTATDLDGLSTTQEVRGLALVDERELVHELTVPERLARLDVALRGSIQDLTGKRVELPAASESFAVNVIDATADTSSAQLLRTPRGYALELRGKDGERKPGRPLALSLWSRDFREPLQVMLQTDAAGRIDLGALEGVERLQFPLGSSGQGEVALRERACVYQRSLHGGAGATLRVPYQGSATEPTRAAFSLLAHDHDAFASLALKDGFLELRDLAPGDYELTLHETYTHIDVRIAAGRADNGLLVGAQRMLEASPGRPLQVRSLSAAGGELKVELANASPGTRIIVVATRYVPPFELFGELAPRWPRAPLAHGVDPAASSYHSGRTLGDEYRYVLERRSAPKFPGNMLRRPSLLLNPWEVAEGAVGHHGAGGPSAFSSRKGRGAGGRGGGGGSAADAVGHGTHPGTFSNLDYLPRPSVTLANLVPDADGRVRVPLAELGAGQLVHVLALDGEQAVYDTLVRDETPLAPRPRHLTAALDARERSGEARRIEFVDAGSAAVIDAARAARVTPLDSLPAVYRLLLSISGDADLAAFEFVTRWPSLARAEQLDLYARYACHELHFFLHEKDPAFFAEVVRPFLAQKLQKTFLDRWLLEEDLRGYLEPWAFGRLGLIERILLVQRLPPGERAAVARLVDEACEVAPQDPARLRRLFDLALANDALMEAFEAPEPEPPSVAPPEEEGRARQKAVEGPATGGLAMAEAEEGAQEDALEEPVDQAQERKDDAERRGSIRSFYRTVDPTRRLIEHDYWHRAPRPDNSFAAVVSANDFWRDFARADPAQPFVSPHVAQASGSLLEMLFALSVLDLPFAAGEHALLDEGQRRTLRAASPLLLVRREIAPVPASEQPSTLLLGESFLRLDDRIAFMGGVQRDKLVTDELLSDVAYVCQVVVTNPTSSPRTVELLLQIPAGSVPVKGGFWTRGRAIDLGPFETEALEYAFYFPAAGDFAHYPVHAAEGERFAGAAAPRTLHVVDTPARVDASSWEEVAQHGTTAEVLGLLDRSNLQRLDLGRIAWRLPQRDFFTALLNRLRARHAYSDLVWSYGLLHEDAGAAREYLEHASDFASRCGAYLDSPLLRIDPFERRSYQHVELDPLVHARAHTGGGLRPDAGSDLMQQYRAFLDVLGYRPRLDAEDWSMATYYLLLQDRVEDALAAFAKIEPAELDSRLQYDYLSAYLCFFTGDVARARELAEPHREHPVAHWRARFRDVLGQLDEAAGKGPAADGGARQDRLAATEPALELASEGGQLALRYANLERCELRFYALDVEMAFSARPFAPADGAAAAYVQPNLRQSVELPAGETELVLDLPAELSTANLRVEARAGGLSRSRTVLKSALDVRFRETYGEVAVSDPQSGAPLPKVYVKCFARLADGTVRFHKDGYTDLRGRFDYVSISEDPDLAAERFAVLVQSDALGAEVRELAPPAR